MEELLEGVEGLLAVVVEVVADALGVGVAEVLGVGVADVVGEEEGGVLVGML